MAAPIWVVSFAMSLSSTAMVPAAGVGAAPLASVDQAALKRTIEERSASFRACYDDALDRDPKARGRVAVKFTIEESGRVSDAVKTAGTTVKDETMVGCVLDVFKSLEFSDWAKQKAVITYPLDFEPPPKEEAPKDDKSAGD